MHLEQTTSELGSITNSGLEAKALEHAEEAEQKRLETMKWNNGREAFMQRAKNCHHLLSTRAQPGVYRSPFQVVSGTVPMVDGAPIEDHLRALPSVQVGDVY